MKKNKGFSLSMLVMCCLVFLGVFITVACCTIGYIRYTKVIEQVYNDKAYQIAYSAIEDFDGDLIDSWFTKVRNASEEELPDVREEIMDSEEYQEYLRAVSILRREMKANYIYMGDQRDAEGNVTTTLLYMIDADNPDDAYDPFVPGDIGETEEKFLGDSIKIYETGERSTNYFYNHSSFGYNTSAIAAIKNSQGKVIGILGVELAMSELGALRTQFIVNTSLFSILIMAFLVIVDVFLIRRFVLKPIGQIVRETETFVENDVEVSKVLGTIRGNREVETLAEGILKMEENINTYITDITKITAEKERISAELDVAANIQSSMLPCTFPVAPNNEHVDIFATMTPAKEVGGDFYDFFFIDKTHLAIVMADVSGKGVPAALFMVIGKTLLKDHTTLGRDLGEVFSEVNNLLCESNSEGLFITAFEGVLDLETGEFRFVNAGHELPFIYRKNTGKFEAFQTKHGFVLAGMEGMKFKGGEFTLAPGDKLFQYTDGVTEATSASNELYGMERLEKILNEVKDESPCDILPDVKADIDAFVGEAPQFDDITMLCFEYKKRMGDNHQLTVDAVVDNVPVVTKFIDEKLEAADCSLKAQTQIDVAIDELFSNIAQYAYKNSDALGKASVDVEIVEDEHKSVKITFTDNGKPYNPLEKEDPDVTLGAEERDIGGLGIFIVKKTMDDMKYEYVDGKNVLTITKRID